MAGRSRTRNNAARSRVTVAGAPDDTASEVERVPFFIASYVFRYAEVEAHVLLRIGYQAETANARHRTFLPIKVFGFFEGTHIMKTPGSA